MVMLKPSISLSKNADKIKILQFPRLDGKTFLDLNCEKGFFCGFAQHLGASRIVGLGAEHKDIEEAKRFFAGCDFYIEESRGDFLKSSSQSFDIVLGLSFLKITHDISSFLELVLDCMSFNGLFILEISVIASNEEKWIQVEYNNEIIECPSSALMEGIVKPYAWKIVHIKEESELLSTYIYHISRKLPRVYLLMQPSSYGKSTIARDLFQKAGIKTINVDGVLNDIALRNILVTDDFYNLIIEDYSTLTLGKTYTRIFDRGFGAELFELLLSLGHKKDIAIDGFIPENNQKEVIDFSKKKGYLPIVLSWDKPQGLPIHRNLLSKKINDFFNIICLIKSNEGKKKRKAKGHVDHVEITPKGILITGWAMNRIGNLPKKINVQINKKKIKVLLGGGEKRVDVMQHYGLSHPWVGYKVFISIPGFNYIDIDKDMFSVSFVFGDKFHFSLPVDQLIVSKA